jgi:LmbE family N-acetylglucosaminyl deacetylase
MATAVFFHAHPDDEAILTGGTMASMADSGDRVVLVTATRGELGEIPDDLDGGSEALADRRALELAEASRILGVARQVYLGYLDSGMAGEDTNTRAGSFAGANIEEAAGRLASLLGEEKADVLVIYDEHGGYDHPDHIQVHRVGVRAAELAGTPILYMATMNRDYMQELASETAATDWEPPEEVAEGQSTMGEPASRITTEIDVTPWIERKRQAMRAHASQISETSFFLAMPDPVYRKVWGREWYIRIRPAAEVPTHFEETALMVDAAAPSGGRVVSAGASESGTSE